jgi:hypothetical protein
MGANGPGDRQILMSIERKDEHTVELGSFHLRITLSILEPFELVLEDEGDLLGTPPRLHLFRSVFYGLEEIEELKTAARPTLNQHNRHRGTADGGSEQAR